MMLRWGLLLVAVGCLWQWLVELAAHFSTRRRDDAAMADERAGDSSVGFCDYFVMRGVNAQLAQAVYRFFSDEMTSLRHFPVRPTDSLGAVYGIDASGGIPLVEAVEELLLRSDLRARRSFFGWDTVKSIEDLVMALSYITREGKQDDVTCKDVPPISS